MIRITVSRFQLKPSEPIVDQIVFATQKAFINGEFQPGQTFSSVRALASALKIHPNTAHEVIQHLIRCALTRSIHVKANMVFRYRRGIGAHAPIGLLCSYPTLDIAPTL